MIMRGATMEKRENASANGPCHFVSRPKNPAVNRILRTLVHGTRLCGRLLIRTRLNLIFERQLRETSAAVRSTSFIE